VVLVPELLNKALTCPVNFAVNEESPPPQLANSINTGSKDNLRINDLFFGGFNNFCDITIFLNQEVNK
jgi:hypothetical protein